MPAAAVLHGLLDGHPWTLLALVALLAVIAAAIAHRVVRGILRRLTRGRVLPNAILDATASSAAAVWPLVLLQVVWLAAPEDVRYLSTVRHANGVLLIAALTWLAVTAIRGVANGVIASHPLSMQDNLHARRVQTQTEVLARSAMVIILIGGTAMALLTFPGARQLGASLLASAGVLGIIGGMAARPVFSNLIAGLQLALAQPLRIDDALVVQGEFGRVEEITGTYVVLKLWDERRMIVPLQWFIENPFQNWTRSNSQIHQTVYMYVDYAMPMDPLRTELQRLVQDAPEWDQRTANLKVTDSDASSLKVRILLSGRTSGEAFDLACKVREGLYAFMAREYPKFLPQTTVLLRPEDPALPAA